MCLCLCVWNLENKQQFLSRGYFLFIQLKRKHNTGLRIVGRKRGLNIKMNNKNKMDEGLSPPAGQVFQNQILPNKIV